MLTPMRTQIIYICTQKTGKVFKTARKEPLGDHDNQLMSGLSCFNQHVPFSK